MTDATTKQPPKPAILAPAGNRRAFLAAIAAGADAVYCGLQQYSARMTAKNFTIETLKPLVELAHDRSVDVYITLNSLLKPDDLDDTLAAISQLKREIRPDALILQDLAVAALARQAGFSGQLHLSTLANAGFPSALSPIHKPLDIQRVVTPRELSIDEIKQMAATCPPELDLEVFIHGAICYAVSGRCYWSSYLGGKSGLRGRCVQPCRRVFVQNRQRERFFACRDLSLDVLVKVLRPMEKIKAWKIEGRKKGPHYVYYTVSAYRMLRDEGTDAKIRRSAVQLLERALGRPGTHYHFLPQRPQNPIDFNVRTGSGLLIGSTFGPARHPYVKLREALLRDDVIRVGYEDQPWHHRTRINRAIPAGGKFFLKPVTGKYPPKGSPVFLTDRQEAALNKMIQGLENELRPAQSAPRRKPAVRAVLPRPAKKPSKPVDLYVQVSLGKEKPSRHTGIWLFADTLPKLPKQRFATLWFWLSPVIWPQTEETVKRRIQRVINRGGRRFVLNAPWQTALFPSLQNLNLWAGPFCNLANPLALGMLRELGFEGAIVSPELDEAACLGLPRQSPLPLGIVLSGNWPLCLSRIVSDELKTDRAFISPRKETAWVTRHDDTYWMYPNWRIDLTPHRRSIQKAGYALMVHMVDPPPAGIEMKKRPGLWNWTAGLL